MLQELKSLAIRNLNTVALPANLDGLIKLVFSKEVALCEVAWDTVSEQFQLTPISQTELPFCLCLVKIRYLFLRCRPIAGI